MLEQWRSNTHQFRCERGIGLLQPYTQSFRRRCPLSAWHSLLATHRAQLIQSHFCALTCLCVVVLQLQDADDWEDELDDILTKFEEETGHRPLYDICFY